MPTPQQAQQMYYGERRPGPSLRLHLAAYWHFRADRGMPATLHWIPPDGCVSVFVDALHARAGLMGPRTQPAQVSVAAGACYFGARLNPGVARALLPVPLASLRDRRVLLAEVGLEAREAALVRAFPPELDEEGAAARWDSVLGEWLDESVEPDSTTLVAALAIVDSAGQTRLGDLARAVGLSPRQLRRRFREGVGLSPKEFARVRRVRASVSAAMADGRSWTAIAAEHAFSDQAHLVREVRRLVGLAPRDLRAHLARIAHGGIVDP